MTTNTRPPQEFAAPPRWAVALLPLLLRADEAETVTGDLIEEYRDTVYPLSGRWRADAWFVRQVAGFAWRTASLWGLLLAAFMTGRFLLDTFAPPANWGPRSSVTTWSVILLYLIAGAWAARRTGRARTGAVVAIGTHLISCLVGAPIHIAVFLAVIQRQPKMLNLFYQTGGWGEEWALPVMLLPVVFVLGLVGGAFGKSLAGRARA
jgi:hypothetical protein